MSPDKRNNSDFELIEQSELDSNIGSGNISTATSDADDAYEMDEINLSEGSHEPSPTRVRRSHPHPTPLKISSPDSSPPPPRSDNEGIIIKVERMDNTPPLHARFTDCEFLSECDARQAAKLEKVSSTDSEATTTSESTLVSNGSETLGNDSDVSVGSGEHPCSKINHHHIRTTLSDSEIELCGMTGYNKKRIKKAAEVIQAKSCLCKGNRFYLGNVVTVQAQHSPDENPRHYLFELLIDKERSWLWDQMQFWEDAFLDAVAAERDAVGMDQGPAEMLARYRSLSAGERKRLEEDEDRLLSSMLHNMIAFLVCMRGSRKDIKRKIRRLLGRSHIGLVYSKKINDLLDQIHKLNGNDIDLKVACSRQIRKHSFVVHSGTDNSGDVLFMEVCDDAIILRSGDGSICERWWYEKLINMTYCPKTKVLCLWSKSGQETKLSKFCTKKCRELYYCIKESMERAASRQKTKAIGPELGGEFPIQDVKTGEGGLLQVTLDGIGFKFANSKYFVELKDIKKCYTKRGMFILQEFIPVKKDIVLRKYKSSMAGEICYAVLCVFSYIAAARSSDKSPTKPTSLK